MGTAMGSIFVAIAKKFWRIAARVFVSTEISDLKPFKSRRTKTWAVCTKVWLSLLNPNV
jgi:hypothetical protein